MNKTILITGASRGLGLCFTRKYLEDGETVFAGVRDTSNPILRMLLEEYPDTLIPVTLEVTDSNSVHEATFLIGKYTKSLDIVINNAAIHNSTSFEILENANIDDCLPVYNVNSLGPLRVVKEFIPFLRNSSLAKIINISSESGSIGACEREKEFDYCMSKAALNMGTKLLANYLRKDKIVVLTVHPGWMRTDMGGSRAHLDPYEAACQLVELFKNINSTDTPIFIDNKGDAFMW
ncbi:MAG: short-chain dehydrogenase/reductase [Herbinix sp.]|jgi:NAD(P)-dependent dehydrogenase (short-subunit alcohol dehydrogenase family)|nr:short-chain dehydrogenase/reductase [Herbinix sp.]